MKNNLGVGDKKLYLQINFNKRMKRILYFVMTLGLMVNLVGCSDMNVLNPVTPSNPNQSWILAHVIDFNQATTTAPVGARFTYKLEKNTNGNTELVVTNFISTNSNTEMKPYGSVFNNGKSIQLEYRDESPRLPGSPPATFNKDVQMTHRFTVNQQGGGTGAPIEVLVKYVYPDPNFGSSRIENRTIQF